MMSRIGDPARFVAVRVLHVNGLQSYADVASCRMPGAGTAASLPADRLQAKRVSMHPNMSGDSLRNRF